MFHDVVFHVTFFLETGKNKTWNVNDNLDVPAALTTSYYTFHSCIIVMLKSPMMPGSYRPICLLPVILQLFHDQLFFRFRLTMVSAMRTQPLFSQSPPVELSYWISVRPSIKSGMFPSSTIRHGCTSATNLQSERRRNLFCNRWRPPGTCMRTTCQFFPLSHWWRRNVQRQSTYSRSACWGNCAWPSIQIHLLCDPTTFSLSLYRSNRRSSRPPRHRRRDRVAETLGKTLRVPAAVFSHAFVQQTQTNELSHPSPFSSDLTAHTSGGCSFQPPARISWKAFKSET